MCCKFINHLLLAKCLGFLHEAHVFHHPIVLTLLSFKLAPTTGLLTWQPCDQVAILYAVQKGFLLDIEPSKVPLRLDLYVHYLRSKQTAVLKQIATSQDLSCETESVLQAAMSSTMAQFNSC
jgi:hypothetical protein